MPTIDCCRACGHRDIKPFFDLGRQPLANALLPAQDAKEACYPLSLCWCPTCNLVQLDYTADPRTLFSNYVWLTATSSTAKEYAEEFCRQVLDRVNNGTHGSYIMEIASNDGTFLKPFLKRGERVLGIDPAANIVETAVADGVATVCAFFGLETAEHIVAERGLPRVVVARNVLPHVANLHDFVEGLRHCLSDDGLLVIEIHYAPTILDELHYDSIYHEHLCYFTLQSLEHLLDSHGIYIEDLIASPISGGSIVVFARSRQGGKSRIVDEYEARERDACANELARWETFAETAREHRRLFLQMLDEEISREARVVGYGASARSATMLNFCDIGSGRIAAIADHNPLKQKRFSPGSRIRIESPEEVLAAAPDVVVVLAWNFLDEITSILRERFGFQGGLLIPLPHPPRRISLQEMSRD